MQSRFHAHRFLLFLAAIAAPLDAGAVVVFNGTAPHVYAVTYLYEDWTQQLAFGGLSGFLDNTEQLEGTDSISSAQYEGIDSIPNPSCSMPCSGMTAEAGARFVDGAIELSANSHTYGNFDDVIVVGDPPDQTYEPAYQDGNILRAETNAAVFERLTITAPVQIDMLGHLTGDMLATSASDSELLAIPNTYFGTGTTSAALVVSLRSTPIEHTVVTLTSINESAFFEGPNLVDQEVTGTTPILSAGDYILRVDLRTTTRVGTVNGPNLAVQDMRSDYGDTASLRFVASDPSAVTSASGLMTFTAPEPGLDLLEEFAIAGLAITLRRRRH